MAPINRPMPRPSDVDLVIYHADCSDGMTAAWAAHATLGDRADYRPAKYGQAVPDVTGRNVAILDFAYDRATTLEMLKVVDSLIVIDHHRTAMIELHDISNTQFDMNLSGATLAWNFFHAGREAPKFVKYVTDKDLWRFEMPYSKEFNSFFDQVPFTFEAYDSFVDESAVDDAIEKGSVILSYSKGLISKECRRAGSRTLRGHKTLVINSSLWANEIGNSLSCQCDVGLVWYVDHCDDLIKVSLRAFHDDVDVSEIARQFGGGGHKRSAGFILPVERGIESIFDVSKQ